MSEAKAEELFVPLYLDRNGARLAAIGGLHALVVYVVLCYLGATSSKGWLGSVNKFLSECSRVIGERPRRSKVSAALDHLEKVELLRRQTRKQKTRFFIVSPRTKTDLVPNYLDRGGRRIAAIGGALALGVYLVLCHLGATHRDGLPDSSISELARECARYLGRTTRRTLAAVLERLEAVGLLRRASDGQETTFFISATWSSVPEQDTDTDTDQVEASEGAVSPSEGAVAEGQGGEQSVTEVEQSVTPPEQSVTEVEQSVTEVEQSVTPSEQSVTEVEQSVTPPSSILEGEASPTGREVGKASPSIESTNRTNGAKGGSAPTSPGELPLTGSPADVPPGLSTVTSISPGRAWLEANPPGEDKGRHRRPQRQLPLPFPPHLVSVLERAEAGGVSKGQLYLVVAQRWGCGFMELDEAKAAELDRELFGDVKTGGAP